MLFHRNSHNEKTTRQLGRLQEQYPEIISLPLFQE